MIIAQITDLHVVCNGHLCQGRVPTYAQAREAVAHINRLDPLPDVVVATGDLTEHGTRDEFDAVREILGDLRPPVYVIPGNHDPRDALLTAFADHAYLPRPGAPFAQYVIDEFPVRLVALDTTVEDQPHGLLCDRRLTWAAAALGAAPDRPTLIFMHHPPFRTGIRWIDAVGLHGGRRLEAIVARHGQVARVVCGHAHRSMQVPWGGTIAGVAGSTSHAQLALALAETAGFDFAFAIEPRAVTLYRWDPGYGLVSHLSYLGAASEMYRSPNASALRAAFERRYEDLCRAEFDAPGPAPTRRTSAR